MKAEETLFEMGVAMATVGAVPSLLTISVFIPSDWPSIEVWGEGKAHCRLLLLVLGTQSRPNQSDWFYYVHNLSWVSSLSTHTHTQSQQGGAGWWTDGLIDWLMMDWCGWSWLGGLVTAEAIITAANNVWLCVLALWKCTRTALLLLLSAAPHQTWRVRFTAG